MMCVRCSHHESVARILQIVGLQFVVSFIRVHIQFMFTFLSNNITGWWCVLFHFVGSHAVTMFVCSLFQVSHSSVSQPFWYWRPSKKFQELCRLPPQNCHNLWNPYLCTNKEHTKNAKAFSYVSVKKLIQKQLSWQ